jgi:Fuc2NAc and GlcNAc transferase
MGLGLGMLASWVTLLAVRSTGLVAQPNLRSSHERPTPTAGGVGFVLVILGFVVLQGEGSLALALVLGGGVLAGLGLVDDLLHVPAGIRLVAHCLMVAVALWLLGGTKLLVGQTLLGGAWVAVALWLFGVWFINLYNFMDGIDGIAATQLLIYCGGAWLLGATDGFTAELAWFASAAVGGFLVFNWAPARIFMGDVGSGFLGFLVWMIALALAAAETVPFVASMVLLTVFWFDATYTLGVRVVTGQAFASAHRSHLYQRLAQRVGHGATVALFVGYALGWLYPLSVAVMKVPQWWPCWVGLGCAPMAVACWSMGAGRLDSPAASSASRT